MFNQNINFVNTKPKLHFSRKKTTKQIQNKNKTKIHFFATPNQSQTKKGNQTKTSFIRKNNYFRFNLGGQTVSEKLQKKLAKCFFFGKSHKVRSTRKLVVQTCAENVRLPTSMQALIWFPEVLRITPTFERIWESRQKPLKNDLTVDNYSRKKKEMRGGVEGHLIF